MCNVYKFISPSGKSFIVSNGYENFCKKHNLTPSSVLKVVNGTRKKGKHKGWKIKKLQTNNTGKPKTYIVINPSGTKKIITNITSFCKKHNLLYPLMIKVANGLRMHHKGWKCKHYN
jgi:hypothetical protein